MVTALYVVFWFPVCMDMSLCHRLHAFPGSQDVNTSAISGIGIAGEGISRERSWLRDAQNSIAPGAREFYLFDKVNYVC